MNHDNYSVTFNRNYHTEGKEKGENNASNNDAPSICYYNLALHLWKKLIRLSS